MPQEMIQVADPTKNQGVTNIPKLLAGRFALEELIGIGGVGSVYSALDQRLNRPVAVKILSQETHGSRKERAELAWREAIAMASVIHPHVVTVLDFGWEGDCAYIVMERLRGQTLERAVEEQGPLPLASFLMFARQSLDALIAAHETGLLHMDLKPSNFSLEPTYATIFHVKVLDFGLSRFWQWPPSKATSPQDACVFGTMHYLAPEQFLQEPVDHRTDLYAFGCVLYEALTGRAPFETDTPAAMMEEHLHKPVHSVRIGRPEITAELEAWIFRFLAKSPADRWQTSLEALAALTHVKVI